MTEERRYSDFDLLIEAAGDERYRARVVDSPAGQATGSFSLPFSDLELEVFMLKVGRPRRGVRRLESPEMEAAREFGSQLFDAVFHDDLKLSLRRSLDAVEHRDEGLRIRLWFSDAPELATLPWEFLFSEADDQFLVLSAWTPIIRYLDLTQPIEPLAVTGPLRILAMISSPHDFPALDVEDEWRRIEHSLQPLVGSGAVVIDRCEDATLLELQRRLRKNDYHIFHFLGHGGFDEKADDGVLVLEDGNNRSRLVAGRDVGTILSDHRSLRLAVLNACEGARAAESDPFTGAAQSLVRKGIPGVVAMQFEITDDAAIAFAQEFYGAIADGLPVDASIGEARRAIFGQGNDIEWGTPVVYLRGDGRLFDVDSTAVVPAAAAGAAVATDETVESPPIVEPEPEPQTPDADEPAEVVAVATVDVEDAPAGTGRSLWQSLMAVPMWLLWTVVAVGAIVLVVLAVNVFGGDDGLGTIPATDAVQTTTPAVETTTPAVETTTPAVETTPATPATQMAEDAAAVAERATGPIQIDGDVGDWTSSVTHSTGHVIYVHPDIEDGSVDRAGEQNDSMIQLAWDEQNLYLFAQVLDDVLSAPNVGNQIWRNDAVNLNIAVLGADGSRSERPDNDDHQLTLSPGDEEAGTSEGSVRFVGDGRMFNENFVGFAEVVALAFDRDYVLEARIPWSEIGVSDPQPGEEFGLIITVFDNDGERVDGRTLQAEIVANTVDALFQRPQTWGTLTLDG